MAASQHRLRFSSIEGAGKEAAVRETLVSPYINPTSQSAYPVWLCLPHSSKVLVLGKFKYGKPYIFLVEKIGPLSITEYLVLIIA